jgi:hypothetical protein
VEENALPKKHPTDQKAFAVEMSGGRYRSYAVDGINKLMQTNGG